MSTSFLERSRLERRVVGMVNEKFQHAVELSGLSSSTIDRWSTDVSYVFVVKDTTKIKKIELLLREISHRISSDSDSSKHIFVNGFFMKNSTTDICVEELGKALSELHEFEGELAPRFLDTQ